MRISDFNKPFYAGGKRFWGSAKSFCAAECFITRQNISAMPQKLFALRFSEKFKLSIE
jgi:hypothetical protein